MSIGDRIGEYKTVIIACIAIVTAVSGATIGVEKRYAKAADVQKEIQREIQQQQSRIDFQVNDLKIIGLQNQRSLLRKERFDLKEASRTRTLSRLENERLQEVEDEIEGLTQTIQKLGGR